MSPKCNYYKIYHQLPSETMIHSLQDGRDINKQTLLGNKLKATRIMSKENDEAEERTEVVSCRSGFAKIYEISFMGQM